MSLPYLQPYLGLSNGLNTLHAAGAGGIGGWVELGRTTLGGTADSITVSSLTSKRYYMILHDHRPTGGYANAKYRLGNSSLDTGSNYAYRYSDNGGADGTGTSQSSILTRFGETTTNSFGVSYCANYASNEKLLIGHTINQNTAGAANAPNRYEWDAKWANTSNVADVIGSINSAGGDMNTGSEMVILGWDPADSHTNNFWEELASVDQTSGASSLPSGSFSARKYLWIQFHATTASTANIRIQFNGDSSTNYAFRYSYDGSADGTNTSDTGIQTKIQTGTTPVFTNVFVINNQSNEKLAISHGVDQNTAAATNAPKRDEVVGKWDNTSNQITSLSLVPNTGNITGYLRIWGAD